jgi:cell division protein FtsB
MKFGKWGKYLITILVFLFIYLFVGDQSLVQFSRRNKEIQSYEQQTRAYRKETEKAEQMLQVLNNKDSLERYARELYYMHENNEDIYIVEE